MSVHHLHGLSPELLVLIRVALVLGWVAVVLGWLGQFRPPPPFA